MEKRICLTNWKIEGDAVRLQYEDGDTLFVKKTDFDRAFGCIVSASKQEIRRDFAIQA